MNEKDQLQQAINTIRDYVAKHAAYHYTIRVEFMRFMENDTQVEIKVEGPDGDELGFDEITDVGEELLGVIEACELSRDHAADEYEDETCDIDADIDELWDAFEDEDAE